MEVLTQHEFSYRKKEILKKIEDGTIFIHPTDTIYGISCNATDEKVVQKLREIKKRFNKPLSIWAPSVEWIKENIKEKQKDHPQIDELPGPFTMIIPLKNTDCIAKNVSFSDTLGVRIPNHWFSQYVEELGFPIITTSANKVGEAFMTSLEDLDKEVEKHVEFIIYEGEKTGKPSKIIDLEKEEVLER